MEQRLHGISAPEQITLIVKKGGRYYVFGYDTAVNSSILVSKANETGLEASDLDNLINTQSWNHYHNDAYDPSTTATYTVENDGAFYLVPYTGGISQNTNVRGIVTVSGTDFMRLDEESAGQGFNLNAGNDTAVYHGCLVNGTYETTGAQNNAAPTSAPTATATQEPTQAPTQAPTEAPTPAQYSVTFNANGGTGSMDGTTANGSYTLPACTFTAPAHKHFTGWKANNEGSSIAVGDEYNVTTAVEFFAQWTDDTSYSVTYNKNAADATGSLTDNTRYYDGDTATVLANNFVRTGYTFKYFTTTSADSGAHYTAGNTITINGAGVTLYAQWQINSYTVTFTDGTSSQNKSYNYNTTITLADENPLTAPSGKEFDKFTVGGADATTLTVTANTTVTVVWKDVASSNEMTLTLVYKNASSPYTESNRIDMPISCAVNSSITFNVTELKQGSYYNMTSGYNNISVYKDTTLMPFTGAVTGGEGTKYTFTYERTSNVSTDEYIIYFVTCPSTVTDEQAYGSQMNPNIITHAILPVPYEDR